MKAKDRECPYHSIKGKEQYEFCSASKKVCHCGGNEWYCDYPREWDIAEYEKFCKEEKK